MTIPALLNPENSLGSQGQQALNAQGRFPRHPDLLPPQEAPTPGSSFENPAHATAGTARSSRRSPRAQLNGAAAEALLKDELLLAALRPEVRQDALEKAAGPTLPDSVAFETEKGRSVFQAYHEGERLGTFKEIDGVRDFEKAKLLAIAVSLDTRKTVEIIPDAVVTAEKDRRLIALLGPEIWERALELAKLPGLYPGISFNSNTGGFRVRRNRLFPDQTFSPKHDRTPLMAEALAIGTVLKAREPHTAGQLQRPVAPSHVR